MWLSQSKGSALLSLNLISLEVKRKKTRPSQTGNNDLISVFDMMGVVCFQKTHASAVHVRQRAETLLTNNHYDPESVRDIADGVTSRWQQLVTRAEERHKLVTASLNFYKTADQVRQEWLLPRLATFLSIELILIITTSNLILSICTLCLEPVSFRRLESHRRCFCCKFWKIY